jgi:hypothetical protein
MGRGLIRWPLTLLPLWVPQVPQGLGDLGQGALDPSKPITSQALEHDLPSWSEAYAETTPPAGGLSHG